MIQHFQLGWGHRSKGHSVGSDVSAGQQAWNTGWLSLYLPPAQLLLDTLPVFLLIELGFLFCPSHISYLGDDILWPKENEPEVIFRVTLGSSLRDSSSVPPPANMQMNSDNFTRGELGYLPCFTNWINASVCVMLVSTAQILDVVSVDFYEVYKRLAPGKRASSGSQDSLKISCIWE